jgi:hypothetical protein
MIFCSRAIRSVETRLLENAVRVVKTDGYESYCDTVGEMRTVVRNGC